MATARDYGEWANLMPPGQNETNVTTFPVTTGVKPETFLTRKRKELGSQPLARKNEEIATLRDYINSIE